MRLFSANCKSVEHNLDDVVACSHCKRITSTIKSLSPAWKDHPCVSDYPTGLFHYNFFIIIFIFVGIYLCNGIGFNC